MVKYNSINIINYEDEEDALNNNQQPTHGINNAKLAPLHNYGSVTTTTSTPTTPTFTNNPHPNDRLTPPFSSPDRPSTLLIGTFNLIATIVGGGVLSLPIVFCKMGIFFTTISMILSAYMTHMSLIMLCYCSRRCGGSSYGEVVRSAFGEKMEEGVSWLLFVFLVFVIMGYMVLIRDIWTPLVTLMMNYYYFGHNNRQRGVNSGGGEEVMDMKDATASDGFDNDDGMLYQEAMNILQQKQSDMTAIEVNSDCVLIGIIVILLPFLFQRSLHALRWNCYIGFASVMILCIALVRGGWQHFHEALLNDDDDDNVTSKGDDFSVVWFKIPSVEEVLFSFPIVTCAFLCHFNIISIQNSLSTPTRQRTGSLIQYAMVATFLLMTLFGLGGYLYAGAGVEGNILLNVPMDRSGGDVDEGEYWLFLLGRIGCGTTLMLAMPLMALPCRESLLEVIDVLFHRSHHRKNTHVVINGDENNMSSIETEQFCWRWCHKCNKNESIQDAIITTEDELMEILPPPTAPVEENGGGRTLRSPTRNSKIIRNKPIQKDWIFRNSFAHYSTTLLIVAMCFFGAVKVRGVAVVWSFIGSSMAFFIAFILPCGCFIVIESEAPTKEEGGDRHVGWIRVAWVIMVFSVIGAIVCTWNSLSQL